MLYDHSSCLESAVVGSERVLQLLNGLVLLLTQILVVLHISGLALWRYQIRLPICRGLLISGTRPWLVLFNCKRTRIQCCDNIQHYFSSQCSSSSLTLDPTTSEMFIKIPEMIQKQVQPSTKHNPEWDNSSPSLNNIPPSVDPAIRDLLF